MAIRQVPQLAAIEPGPFMVLVEPPDGIADFRTQRGGGVAEHQPIDIERQRLSAELHAKGIVADDAQRPLF